MTFRRNAFRDGEPEGVTGFLSPRGSRWLLWGLVVSGIVLRLIQFAARPSLWYDEAMISLNIATRSWAELLTPLAYDQTAPVIWLWAQKLLVMIGGVNEFALRFLALGMGILLIPLVWIFARRILSTEHALLVTALVSYSPMLIRYANLAKPYGVDVTIAVGLSLLAFDLSGGQASRKKWLRLVLAGLAAITISMPAILVLAGIGMALLLNPSVRAMRFGISRVILMGIAWVGMFGGFYVAFYRGAAQSKFMQDFWEFALLRPNAPDLGARVGFAIHDVMSGALVGSLDAGRWGQMIMSGTEVQAQLAAVLCIVGTLSFVWRREFSVAALLAGPILAALVASTIGFYPITVRLMLFTLPAFYLLLVRGIVQVGAWTPPKLQMSIVVLLAVTFLGPEIGRGLLTSISPIRQQDSRPVIAEFARQHRGTDPVYIYAAAMPAWAFYTTNWAAPDTARLRRIAELSSSGGAAFPNMMSRAGPVVGEGEELSFLYEGHAELIGVPTGRPVRWGGVVGADAPDPRWAENEASRIRRAGERVWVFFVPIYVGDREPNLPDLLSAIADHGGVQTFEFHRREADLYYFQF